jgi:hypothetical protein
MNFLLVNEGDMIELNELSTWTQKIRGDYSKKSREWRHEGGWFLVVEKNIFRYDMMKGPGPNNPAMICFDIYSPSENYWAFFRVSAKSGKPEDEHVKLLNHLPAL